MTDFRSMPFDDESFRVVVFDPPHLVNTGPESWQAAKYGRLTKETWQEDLRAGFAECFRVLKPEGVLIFKWNETQITVSRILALTDQKPLIGHKSGKASKTHWITFMKASLEKPNTDHHKKPNFTHADLCLGCPQCTNEEPK